MKGRKSDLRIWKSLAATCWLGVSLRFHLFPCESVGVVSTVRLIEKKRKKGSDLTDVNALEWVESAVLDLNDGGSQGRGGAS